MFKLQKTIFQLLIFFSSLFQFLRIFINCQQSSSGNKEFPQEKPLNKFLYQLQKSEGVKEEISNYSPPPINPLFFSLNNLRNPPPPTHLQSQIHSNILLLPNPAQLPSIFRLSATPMSQSQAFPLNSSLNSLLEKQISTQNELFTTKSTISNSFVSTEENSRSSSVSQNNFEEESSTSTSSPSTNSFSSSPSPESTTTNNLFSTSSTQSLQLSTTLDFPTFLQSVNISEKYKEEFLKLMESEILRRLENRLNENNKEEKIETETNPIVEEIQRKQNKQQTENLHYIKEENENNFGGSRRINSDFPKRSELRTVNTRLFSLLTSGEGVIGGGNDQQERTLIDQFNSNSAENLNNNSLNENDYRKREQEEFDKLLSKLNEETNKQQQKEEEEHFFENNNKKENEDVDLINLLIPSKLSKPLWATQTTTTITINNNNDLAPNKKQLIITTTITPKIEINEDRDRAIMMLKNRNHRASLIKN
uniref:Uncharacterized protein n=1 Tax=Meloidogyne enterolobii TaxID=390850 RepID=A0A6V7TSL4_MELEN|nr:unnamed protein product [Meloidogyne enterolobii]